MVVEEKSIFVDVKSTLCYAIIIFLVRVIFVISLAFPHEFTIEVEWYSMEVETIFVGWAEGLVLLQLASFPTYPIEVGLCPMEVDIVCMGEVQC